MWQETKRVAGGSMSRLYIQCDYKDKNEKSGTIYNRPRKNEKPIYLSFTALSDDNFIDLRIHQMGTPKENDCEYHLEKDWEINFTLKSILFFVEQRIERIMGEWR